MVSAQELVKQHRFLMLSKSWCPDCHYAIAVFKKYNVLDKIALVELDKMPANQATELEKQFTAISGRKWVPTIFFNGEVFGTEQTLKELDPSDRTPSSAHPASAYPTLSSSWPWSNFIGGSALGPSSRSSGAELHELRGRSINTLPPAIIGPQYSFPIMLRTSLRSLAKPAARVSLRFYSSYPLSTTVTLPNGKSYEQPTGLFINNEFVPSKQHKTFEVINPATEEEICHVYEARKEDVDDAVDAAEKAFKGSWSTADPAIRGKALWNLAELLEAHKDTLAAIESLDNGKALQLAHGDVALVINYIRSCAGWADKLTGQYIDTGDTHHTYTKREPIGVCGQIIPWNFPLLMWSWKVGPALAAGNTVVLKTAESTPLSALYASQLVKEAGIPAGVVNIVSGFGKITGDAIASHPKIKKLAFTGSTATGRHIMKVAADSNLKKVTLELGGKSANIVFDDADVKTAISALVAGIFYNSGEVCSAGSRVFVQEGIYEEILREFKAAAETLKVGDPFDLSTFQGAQTSQMQLNKILGYVDIAHQEGGRLITGGERLGNKGFFVKPTIFADVTPDMRAYKEEIFGPFAVITPFKTADEVIKLANDSEYGLAAGVHTKSIDTATYVSNKLEAGSVWINTYNDFHQMVPFGGYKQSGIGREMGAQALDNYTQWKAVRIGLQKPT
ncbi:hypothetical protein KL919_000141 [Ogataea angusta]|nr:hypothetical protein KL919_000141 [Ogataea angusta]